MLSRSENEDVRVMLRPRGCSPWAWLGRDEDEAERPRKGGSDGARKAPPVPWVDEFTRGTIATELEGVDGEMVFGEGVRERDLLRDLERDLDRDLSCWPSGELTITSGPAVLSSIVAVEASTRGMLLASGPGVSCAPHCCGPAGARVMEEGEIDMG